MKTLDGKPPRPDWPMLLQYAGEAELRVVRDQDAWELDPDLHSWPYQPEDRMIDSAGVEYRLEASQGGGGRHSFVATGRRYDAPEVQSIAERHIENLGAQPQWLAERLRDIAESHRIRATILYLSKLAAEDSSETAEDS